MQEQRSLLNRLWAVAWALALFLALSACAAGLVMHSFSFDVREDPGVELLDYRYGDSRQPGARANRAEMRNGKVDQVLRITGDMRRPGDLYVKWRVLATGQVYEDTVDLSPLLPRDITNHRVHFEIRNQRLFVYLVTPEARRSGEPPNGPRLYQDLHVITLWSNQGRETRE